MGLFENVTVLYHGQRSAEAFATFIREQLVKEYSSLLDWSSIGPQLDDKKRNAIGYFDSKESSVSYLLFFSFF